MTAGVGSILGLLLMASSPQLDEAASQSGVINIRELQIDVALGRARARTLSRARRDSFGRLLLMRRNFRLRSLREISGDHYSLRE